MIAQPQSLQPPHRTCLLPCVYTHLPAALCRRVWTAALLVWRLRAQLHRRLLLLWRLRVQLRRRLLLVWCVRFYLQGA